MITPMMQQYRDANATYPEILEWPSGLDASLFLTDNELHDPGLTGARKDKSNDRRAFPGNP